VSRLSERRVARFEALTRPFRVELASLGARDFDHLGAVLTIETYG
jgi:hypothetical protein